jgi:hypothetical protein
VVCLYHLLKVDTVLVNLVLEIQVAEVAVARIIPPIPAKVAVVRRVL